MSKRITHLFITYLIALVWVLSGIQKRMNTVVQIVVVAVMNVLEFFLVPDLLLWGSFSAVFALLFIIVVYYNGKGLTQKKPDMLSFLKNHLFAVEAFFDSTMVLAFAVKKEEVEALIPECLTLDVFDDQWAFIAMAMVQTRGLRPKGIP